MDLSVDLPFPFIFTCSEEERGENGKLMSFLLFSPLYFFIIIISETQTLKDSNIRWMSCCCDGVSQTLTPSSQVKITLIIYFFFYFKYGKYIDDDTGDKVFFFIFVSPYVRERRGEETKGNQKEQS